MHFHFSEVLIPDLAQLMQTSRLETDTETSRD